MEGSSPHEEERTSLFYVYHPCHFLQEALKALFKCLGIESGTACSMEEEEDKSSQAQICDADLNTNSPTNTQNTSQDAADPPSTTTQNTDASFVARLRHGGRRSDISDGSGGQHN